MQGKLHQYHLIKEIREKYSHMTYLASPADEPEHQVVLIAFDLSLAFAFPQESEHFLQKAQHIQSLRHPHLLPVLDKGIEKGQPFAVREYLPHGSLRSRLKSISPNRLVLGEALTIISQVGQALAYAHKHHLFHGNIKPENILFDAHDQPFLTDFHLVERNDAIIRDQTTEEYACCYLAPEQFTGSITEKSDQYSLGCLAYELITGHVPFAAQTLASMIEHQKSSQPLALSERVADVPPSLEAAVLKTLAKDPTERFEDFSLFLEVIEAVLLLSPAFSVGHAAASGKQMTTSRHTRRWPNIRTIFSSSHKVAVSPDSLLGRPEAGMLSDAEQHLEAPMVIEAGAETLSKLEDHSSQQTMTRQTSEEQVDDLWLDDLFEEQESNDLSTTGAVSFEPEQLGSSKDKKHEIIVPLLNEKDRHLRKRTQHNRRKLLGLMLVCLVIFVPVVAVSGTYTTFFSWRTSKPEGLIRPTQVMKEVLIPIQGNVPPTQPSTPVATIQSTRQANTIPVVIPTPSLVVHHTTTIDDRVVGTGLNEFNYVGSGWDYCTNSCSFSSPCVNSGLYDGSNTWDPTTGDYVTLTFTGTQIKLYAVLANDRGFGAISIDGGREMIIDFYAANLMCDQLLWTSPMLPAATHTFKLRVTGTKDSNSGDSFVAVDRVDILS